MIAPWGVAREPRADAVKSDQWIQQLNFRHSKNQLNDFVPNQPYLLKADRAVIGVLEPPYSSLNLVIGCVDNFSRMSQYSSSKVMVSTYIGPRKDRYVWYPLLERSPLPIYTTRRDSRALSVICIGSSLTCRTFLTGTFAPSCSSRHQALVLAFNGFCRNSFKSQYFKMFKIVLPTFYNISQGLFVRMAQIPCGFGWSNIAKGMTVGTEWHASGIFR